MEITGLNLQNIFLILLPGLHSPYIQDSGVTHSGVCLHSMEPQPQAPWESPTVCC